MPNAAYSAKKAATSGAFSFATNRSFAQRPDWNRSQENRLFLNRGAIHAKNIDKAAQGGRTLQKDASDTIKWPDGITTLKILI